MKISPPLSTALTGIQSGLQKFQENSAKIAQDGGNIDAAVGILQSEQQVKASAKALETENNLQKTIIDTFA